MKSIFSFALVLLCIVSTTMTAQKRGVNNNDTKEIGSRINDASYLENMVNERGNTNYIITSEHVSSVSGIKHTYVRQAVNGIEVLGTESSIHRNAQGKTIQTNVNFVNEIASMVGSSSPSLNAEQAIRSVAGQMRYQISNLLEIERTNDLNGKIVFNKAGISNSNIPVKLMYYFQEGKGVSLIWELSVEEKNSSDWWNFRVDASTGRIIDKENFTVSCLEGIEHSHEHGDAGCEEIIQKEEKLFYTVANASNAMVGSYNVTAMPDESPQHGSLSRTVVANPDNAVASPFGWHDTNGSAGAESEYTIGNNTDAYDDRTSTTSGTGSGVNSERAFGGPSLTFDDPFNIDVTAGGTDGSIDAAVTNLFYWANIIHDVFYLYGFDEASGNFQENNYGNGGVAGDSVRSEAQDGSGTCNANFSTPTDGGKGRMQMYVCGTRDGDFDNGVIIHEYAHGISTRLTGGAGTSSCLNNDEQMGEGWGDFYGLVLTMEAGDAATDPRGIGTWLLGQAPTGPGIRDQRYDTDTNTYSYDTIKTASLPHGVGSVWAMMLWEMTWDLIAIHGWDPDIYNGSGGNNIALNLVTEGMKLQGCSPGFIDGRDAILAADVAIYGGDNRCTIWAAFTRRGLGNSASQGSSGSRADGTEAYDLPSGVYGSSFVADIEEVCITSGVQTGLGGGLPTGGVYSGPGVTDDANGMTYTFDPNIAGVGSQTIIYTVTDCNSNPVPIPDTIQVTDGIPTLTCQSITLTLDGSGNAIYDPLAPTTATLVGGNNGSNNPGTTSLQVSVTQNVTVSFDWLFDTTDDPAFDSFGYTLNGTYTALSAGTGDPQSGSFSLGLTAGNTFGFTAATADNTFGGTTTMVTNFSPGFIGQFASSNWSEVDTNSDGTTDFSGASVAVGNTCGNTLVPTSSKTMFSCNDIGDNTITVTVDNGAGGMATCNPIITIVGETTTYTGSWDNGVPDAGKKALFNSNYSTATADIDACSCEVANNATVTVAAGDYMNINGNITVGAGSSLIVQHTGSIVQVDDTASVTNSGTINVNLTTPSLNARDFLIMGSPMSTSNNTMFSAYQVLNHTTANFTPYVGVPAVVGVNFHDQEGNDWSNFSGTLAPAEGYLVRPSYTAGGTYNYVYNQGTLNNGIITYSAFFGDDKEDSPNVMSNPYPSAIDADLLINNNAIVDELYFWEHNTTPASGIPGPLSENFNMEDISTRNYLMGVAAATGGGIPSNVISTGQGFGIKANAAGDVTFNNALRLTSGNGTIRQTADKDLLWIEVRENTYGMGSSTGIGFTEEATEELDQGYDTMKLGTVVSLYTHLPNGTEQFGIQGREAFNSSITIPMGFSTMIEADAGIPYVINIANLEGTNIEQATVYLIDHLTNTVTDLSTDRYEFLSDAGTFNNRFTLQFESIVLGTDDLGLDSVSVYPNPTQNVLNIISPKAVVTGVEVYDVRGRVVSESRITAGGNNYRVDLSELETALYFVKITTESGTITKRVVKQ